MWPRFGVKISNSTFCIAYAKEDGKIEVIANKQGDRVSPACLFCEESEIEVGVTAKQKMSAKPGVGITNNLLLFGPELEDEEIERALKLIPCKFNNEVKEYELIKQGETKPHKTLSPYEVCVEFFKATFELARQCHLHEEHPSVVLSIPEYYPHRNWKILSEAADEAGFHVAQIITEPTAAVLAYEMAEDEKLSSKIVLYIKTGGLCTSLALFELGDGFYTVLKTVGPFYIGGSQITSALADFICNEFYKKNKLDPNESRRSKAKVTSAAENCKHILTSMPTTQVYIDSLMDGVDFNMQLTRARYESIMQPFLNDYSSTLTSALKEVNEDNRKIDEIILAGATLKIPKIQSLINSLIPDANVNTKFAPDEVVAIGCARQSLFIHPDHLDLENTEEIYIVPENIYIWHNDTTKVVENGIDKKSNKLNEKDILCEKGMTVPNVFRIFVTESNPLPSTVENNAVTFSIQCGEFMKDIQVNDLKSKDGKFHLEISIELNDEHIKHPVINIKPADVESKEEQIKK
ncbi:heat shock 70 kDa protein 14 [Condylostylus longicornis]|uniref:heat shock 70 kDa protein 14 n=1 Tax=Condylostylus longicornis TaxID=2530218 RepID=UPI00244DD026|nr:heat shock 70 kDa protein 14 [Condylostylus longicornis]